VVSLALRGTFQNCGQNCVGLERVVAHAGIYDRLVDTMNARVNALTQGPPMRGEFDCGAMTMGPAQVYLSECHGCLTMLPSLIDALRTCRLLASKSL
jgi:acyl-CoA reductase-like NAD-dependent aldehyde dehydrogenase